MNSTFLNKYHWLSLVIIVGCAFAIFEHQYTHLERQVRFVDEEEIEKILSDSTESGTGARQAGFMALGCTGVLAYCLSKRRAIQFANPVVWCSIAYVSWAVLSFTWSSDPMMTLKRIIVLLCCVVGAVGLAKALSPTQIALMALTIASSYILLGLFGELALGGFRPWKSEYRFRGTVHPNVQAAYAAFCAFAAFFLRKQFPKWTPFLNVMFVCAVCAVYLTKSRMALGAFIAAMALTVLFQSRSKQFALISSASTLLLGVGMLVLGLGGAQMMEKSSNAALLGRTEQTGSFSGRVPLWEEILEYVEKSPMKGYAYASFWNADRIETIKKHQEWAIDSSHSIYLEALADLGYVGLAIFLLGAIFALIGAVRQARNNREDGAYAFFVAVILFCLFHGLMESHYVKPFFVTFMAACGIMSLNAFRNATTEVLTPPPATPYRNNNFQQSVSS